jgi:hypothetical protein
MDDGAKDSRPDESLPATPPRFVQYGFELPPDDLEALKDIAHKRRTTIAALLVTNGIIDTLTSAGVQPSPYLALVGQRPRGRPRRGLID